jgi:hypothetical protein
MGKPNLKVNGAQQTERSYLSLMFMNPQGLDDYITSSWNKWGIAISGFITLIVAIIGLGRGWFLIMWNKLKRNSKQEYWY